MAFCVCDRSGNEFDVYAELYSVVRIVSCRRDVVCVSVGGVYANRRDKRNKTKCVESNKKNYEYFFVVRQKYGTLNNAIVVAVYL